MNDEEHDDEHDEDEVEHFVVTVGGGGGPEAFAAALARKFRRLIPDGNWCVVLTPTFSPALGRYVQALVTAAGIRVESVGERYLSAPGAELTERQLAALEARGWFAPPGPDTSDDDWGWPHNWWHELTGPGAPEAASAILTIALVEVHDLAPNEPVRIEIFPTTQSDWRWEPDPDGACGGHLAAV